MMLKSTFSGLSRIANGIAIAANIAGTLVVLALVLVVNFDIFARNLFDAPFMGAVEVVQFSIVLIVFLQLPDVVRVERLTASDGFQIVIGKHFPRFTAALRGAINLLSAVFMALVTVAIFPQFTEMWHTGHYFGVPGVFTAPWWPIKLVILLSAGLCTILFVLKVLLPRLGVQMVHLLPEYEDGRK